ncbi:MAG: DUF1858 domain-containing protein [Clostridia bacterium]|nr:DUF1858 domain-containing protein [Clostridia bacterium]
MVTITPDMMILDVVVQGNAEAVEQVLTDIGMHCLHCAFAHGETVEEAALVHGIDVNELVKRLNEAANS